MTNEELCIYVVVKAICIFLKINLHKANLNLPLSVATSFLSLRVS